jgi:hypothetical protein
VWADSVQTRVITGALPGLGRPVSKLRQQWDNLRHVDERITKAVSRVGHSRAFSRRLPRDPGGCRFPASLEGGAKFLKRDPHNFDPGLTRLVQQYVKPGSLVWNVGANVGLFAFAGAGLAGEIRTCICRRGGHLARQEPSQSLYLSR